MCTFLAISQNSLSPLLFPQPSPSPSNSISITHSFLFFHPFLFNTHHSFSTPKPRSFFKFTPSLLCASKSNPTTDLDDEYYSADLTIAEDDEDDGDDDIVEDEEGLESLTEDGVYIEVMKIEKNTRRIESRISIEASLDAIWSILTDYERLSDFIPGLAVSQLIQKGDRYARLLQIGQQNLAFGIKFNAKGVVDCYEKELETLPSGMKRDIEFKMVEGDFQIFEGKWSILQQFNIGSCEESQEVNTTLSYIVDVKPKLWLPVNLIEGRLCNEIKKNLASIRKEAQKDSDRAVHAQ
ncbi:putative START-like domain-containing protein [Lupinus albus]|uniref:Putative START-like domain-containing protein n=1 Tax=Lupinus albus TaxID=3870 RepID=A0A6A4QVI6_LUPAL|nr:putative START-like domain-containing protein [Lupinus albus]